MVTQLVLLCLGSLGILCEFWSLMVLVLWLNVVGPWPFHCNLWQRYLDSKQRSVEYRLYGNYRGKTVVSFK